MDFFIPSQSRCARQLIPFWRKCATSPGRGSLSKGRALGKPVLAIGFRPAGSFAAGLRGFVSVFERMCNCGMKSEHLVGTNIPRFTYDTPTVPENFRMAGCHTKRFNRRTVRRQAFIIARAAGSGNTAAKKAGTNLAQLLN